MAGVLDGFVPAAQMSELPPGHVKCVAVDRQRVLLANVDGALYALRDACGHRGASMATGKLYGYALECPLHYALFDVRTGVLLSGPAAANLTMYEVRVDGDTVYVRR